jgi:hypothetical protein
VASTTVVASVVASDKRLVAQVAIVTNNTDVATVGLIG